MSGLPGGRCGSLRGARRWLGAAVPRLAAAVSGVACRDRIDAAARCLGGEVRRLGWTRCCGLKMLGEVVGPVSIHIHIPIPAAHRELGGGFWSRIGGPEGCAGWARWRQGLSPQPPRLPRSHLRCCHSLWGLVAAFPFTNPGDLLLVLATVLPRAPEKSHLGVGDARPTAWGRSWRAVGLGMAEQRSWEGRWP